MILMQLAKSCITDQFQRQQRRVSEENAVFFDILLKALPPPPPGESEDPLVDEGALSTGEGTGISNHVMGNGEAGGGKK